ncbi:MAG: gamma-glutamyltransferase [Acidobacteria bacterium]|nr:gamma-glutamyltransferase [Acidobacteriota bacterium]
MKICSVMFVFLMMAPLSAADRVTGRPFATRSQVIAQNGIAATSHPLATQIALDILKQGGNAVDAAIAANAALGLMEPSMSGIGGDLFALLWVDKEQKLYGLNASGRSPYALTSEEFKKRNLKEIPILGPLPVSVPGAVDGWFELHEKFGKLAMETILEPAIHYAREGFPVTQVISSDWAGSGGRREDQPNFASTFLPQGKAPSEGEIFRNPDLAGTLEQIAQGGREVFYKGEIAQKIDAFCQHAGCFLRYRDLMEHTSTWVDPVSVNYRGYDVWELPPNGQGIAVLQMLNILEAFDLRSMGHNSADYLHHLVEAKKIAFEDRAKFYADPDFSKIPVAELISKEYAQKRRELLDPERASSQIPAGDPKLQTGDTIYLTVADQEHNMISLIQSNYSSFGSGLVPDGLGFVLQNRGALFNLEEGHFNSYAPHKRPFHTIIPAFVTHNGKPFMSFGVMGGDMQPQGHVQILANILDFGMNLQEAGDAPRFRHFGSSMPTGSTMRDGGELGLESGIPVEVQRHLVEKGHRLHFVVGSYGGYQAILYDARNDAYRGASDSRKDGMAAGY